MVDADADAVALAAVVGFAGPKQRVWKLVEGRTRKLSC